MPGADLAANLIGFTGQDMTGLEGLEARYDELLRGVNGKQAFEAGQGELATPIPGGYSDVTPAQPGSSLALTIDRDLQYETQRILSELMQGQARASIGAAVVHRRSGTGEVLAQASEPTYNAAQLGRLSSRSTARTRRPASSSTPARCTRRSSSAPALQEGVITPDTTFKVANTITQGRHHVRRHAPGQRAGG